MHILYQKFIQVVSGVKYNLCYERDSDSKNDESNANGLT